LARATISVVVSKSPTLSVSVCSVMDCGTGLVRTAILFALLSARWAAVFQSDATRRPAGGLRDTGKG
jgi:hypothetical protein